MQSTEAYYRNIFPASAVYKAFASGNGHREFSFTLERRSIPERYCFFDCIKDFYYSVSSRGYSILRIDIGPIYGRKTSSNDEEKPSDLICGQTLVFDIDATDFDDYRTCGCASKKKQMCDQCWRFPLHTARNLERVLGDVFGLYRMLFVFSGNRGIHVWVPGTELYSNEYRFKIVNHIGKINARVDREANDMLRERVTPDVIADYVMKNCLRIDSNVTRSESHCLKCPFSMHPTTRKISLPLPLDVLEAIMPSCMPNVETIFDPNNAHLLQKSLTYFSQTMVDE